MTENRSVWSVVGIAIITLCLFPLLTSCGGGGSDGGGSSSGFSASITLAASATTMPADGTSSVTLTATIVDSNGKPVPHYTAVSFSTSLGHFKNGSPSYTVTTQPPLTNGKPDTTAAATGIVTTSLIAGTTAGTATVVCSSSGVTQKIAIQFTGGSGAAASLSLGLSQTSVKSDNTDASTITATVLDANNAALQDVVVAFSAGGGQISASSGKTDANGHTSITFSSGTTNRSNQTVAITASVSGLSPATIPIQITGSTLTMATNETTITGNSTVPLTVSARDAGGTGVYNAAISFDITPPGGVIVDPPSGATDVSGDFTVNVTGNSAGAVTVTATGLGTQKAQSYTVTGIGTGFEIVLPKDDPYSARTRTTATLATTADNTSIAFVNGSPDVITRSDGGSFAAENYVGGDKIMVGGSTNNDGVYTIAGVSPATLTLVTSGSLSSESAGAPVTLTNGVLVRVRAPSPIIEVVFAATIGGWDGNVSPITKKAKSPGTDYVWAVLTSTQSGSATIQAYDSSNSNTYRNKNIVFSAPSADAAKITLQASAYVVPPTSGGNSYKVTLTATVRSSSGQVVGDAPVAFSIENPTGGGEMVKPVVVDTDTSGIAKTDFYSGSLSSGAKGVTVNAWVVGEGTTTSNKTIAFVDTPPPPPNPPDTITRADGGSFIFDGFEAGEEIRVQGSLTNDGYYTLAGVTAGTLTLVAADSLNPEPAGAAVTLTAVTASVSIVIGGTAGSVAIGAGSTIYPQDDATYYNLMSVMVSDANGNPVSGAVVSLSAWPSQYSSGVWYDQDPSLVDDYTWYISGTFSNEDVNENMILDPGEDTDGDGKLTPPSSAAGDVPATVTTDAAGVAQFKLVYLKASAVWIVARIRASTVVLGTEMSSSLDLALKAEKVEAKAGLLPNSAYPIGLVTSTTQPVNYLLPPAYYLSQFSADEPSGGTGTSIVDNTTGIYTYTPTGGKKNAAVGDHIWNWIKVTDTTSTVGGAYIDSFVFPARIIIK